MKHRSGKNQGLPPKQKRKIEPAPGLIVYALVNFSDKPGFKYRPVLLTKRCSDTSFYAYYFTKQTNHDEYKVAVWREDINGYPLTYNPSYLVLNEIAIVEENTFYNATGTLTDEKKNEVKQVINRIKKQKGIQAREQEGEQIDNSSFRESNVPQALQRPPKPPKTKSTL